MVYHHIKLEELKLAHALEDALLYDQQVFNHIETAHLKHKHKSKKSKTTIGSSNVNGREAFWKLVFRTCDCHESEDIKQLVKDKIGCMSSYCLNQDKEDHRSLMTENQLKRERALNPSLYRTKCCRCDEYKFRAFYSPDCAW